MKTLILWRMCEYCGCEVERTFQDSWTGKEFCLGCLAPLIGDITESPQSEGDNLDSLLNEDEDEDHV